MVAVMAQREPTAAQSLYPHLPSGERPEVKQRTPTLADAMFPSLSREQKAKEASQAWEREWVRKEQKASNARTVERLRQINERLAREGR
jgi:hypothetical protein